MVPNTFWMFQNSFNRFPCWKFRLFIIFLYSTISLHLLVVTSVGGILDHCNQYTALMVVPDTLNQIPNIFNLENLLVKYYI